MKVDQDLSAFLSRATSVAIPDAMGSGELTEKAKELRTRYNLPINPVERDGPFELTIPFDPAADVVQTAKIVNAYDFDDPIRFVLRLAKLGGYEFEMSAKVADFRVRHRKNWKQPRFVVALAPTMVEENFSEYIAEAGESG